MNRDKVQNVLIALLAVGILVTGVGLSIIGQRVQSLLATPQPKQIDYSDINSRIQYLERLVQTDEVKLDGLTALADAAEKVFSYEKDNQPPFSQHLTSDWDFIYDLPPTWHAATSNDPETSSIILLLTPFFGDGLGGLELGCRVSVADYSREPNFSYQKYIEGIQSGFIEEALVNVGTPYKLVGSLSPATVVSLGEENASTRKVVYVNLGKKIVTVRTSFTGDVINIYQLQLQHSVIDTCLEIAKTIKAK